jgi:protein involved in polysaccharide export with SLBB domain
VNFGRCNSFPFYMVGGLVWFNMFLVTLIPAYLAGCSTQVHLPSPEKMAEFENAGPSAPSMDFGSLVRAKMGGGPYHAVSGDVLELSIPVALQVPVNELPDFRDKIAPYLCRVSDSGVITLPMVGEIQVAGKTLPEIESAIIDAYYPTYIRTRPSVIARVAEYKTHKTYITGAVQKPGLYELRSDQMSLVALLMHAGGITDAGATRIRIKHTNQTKARSEKQIHAASLKGEAKYLSYQSTKAEGVKPASHYLGSNKSDGDDTQMTFRQVSPASTIGRLTIRREQTILFSEQLDITNEIQRWAILDKLAETEPHVSTAEAGRIWVRLCELAEFLKPESGISKPQKTFATEYVATNINNRIDDIKQDTNSNKIIKTHSSSFGVVEKYQNTAQPETIEFGKDSGTETIVLPVKGLNIPSTDVNLEAGDIVEVEPFETPLFTVVGLVNKPGNFPYPPTAQYNLMQALAFAGGLDRVAKPRYATVYRLKEDGGIVRVSFQIKNQKNGPQLSEALSIPIKAGDIVVVEDTPRTRTNEFLQRIFNFSFGAYVPLIR